MRYITRQAEKAVEELARMFGAVLVTGARQVGKSTLLEHVRPDIKIITLDNAGYLQAALEAPETFFDYNEPPLFIDEIQKAPALFPEIKQVVDRHKEKGLFFLSGSEQFQMMTNVTESLAGRVGIVNLMGLSLREKRGESFNEIFLPTPDYLKHRTAALATLPALSSTAVWKQIHRGSMPELAANPGYDWSRYYGSYVRTYIERDVRRLTQVGDELQFQSFMAVVAARTGQMLNLTDIASDVGISSVTAQKWLSILTASNLVYLLRPYFTNQTKRAIKTPKLYFTDTGLAAYLTRWTTPEVLREGAMAGAFFETFVITEILKSYYNRGELDLSFYYYRDKDKHEIDLLIIQDGIFHPVEIKKAGLARESDTSTFRIIDSLPGAVRGAGGVICLTKELLPVSGSDVSIPVAYL